MNQYFRILLHLFGPTVLTSLGFAVIGSIAGNDFSNFLKGWIFIGIFAGLYSALPSIIYTIEMEYLYSRWLKEGSIKSILVSSVSGGICGAIVFALSLIGEAAGPSISSEGLSKLIIVGFIVGLVIALIIKASSKFGGNGKNTEQVAAGNGR